MIHKACMPVYMNSGKIVADGTGRVDGDSKVLQEVLADLKRSLLKKENGYKRHPKTQCKIEFTYASHSLWWQKSDNDPLAMDEASRHHCLCERHKAQCGLLVESVEKYSVHD